MPHLSLNVNSEEETIKLARTIGSRLSGGEVIELVSDLGGGKTTFTKGLVAGANSKDKVHSPSFTIENEYKALNLVIHHLDFYRLNDPGIMKNELIEMLEDPYAVVVVEWANIIENVLPESRLIISIIVTGTDSREMKFTYPDKLCYLIEGL